VSASTSPRTWECKDAAQQHQHGFWFRRESIMRKQVLKTVGLLAVALTVSFFCTPACCGG